MNLLRMPVLPVPLKRKKLTMHRVQDVSSLKDVDVVVDLRELNKGCEAKYELFWTKCSEQLVAV